MRKPEGKLFLSFSLFLLLKQPFAQRSFKKREEKKKRKPEGKTLSLLFSFSLIETNRSHKGAAID
jgi:membrane-anchored protein YejM (alkaline phosphatase superfamily)